MKQLRIIIVMVAVLLTAIIAVTPVSAWGASVNVAAVDDESGTSTTSVYSNSMGYVQYSDYPSQTFTTVQPGDINAATLANYDTLFLFASNPALFSASQKSDIVAWIGNGGKLIIWDSEDPYPNTWDYTWLPTPFATAVPGALGAQGKLFIVEENQLSTFAAGPYQINNYTLSTYPSDAVGDANVFTSYVPSDWCVDMMADNALNVGILPTHVYTKAAGNGIVIYSGLDWDYAGANYGQPAISGALKQILRNEFNAYSLPCSGTPPQGTLTVDKTCDKTVYAEDDLVVCTITVTNPTAYTAMDVTLVDYPPAQVSMGTTTVDLGDMTAGQTIVKTLRGTADAEGCNLENKVAVTGFYAGLPVFTGGDTAIFDIGTNCGGCPPGQSCVPEFPSLALPVGMILGLAFVVYSMRKN